MLAERIKFKVGSLATQIASRNISVPLVSISICAMGKKKATKTRKATKTVSQPDRDCEWPFCGYKKRADTRCPECDKHIHSYHNNGRCEIHTQYTRTTGQRRQQLSKERNIRDSKNSSRQTAQKKQKVEQVARIAQIKRN